MKRSVISILLAVVIGLFASCAPNQIGSTEPEVSASSETARLRGESDKEIVVGCDFDADSNALDPVYEDGSVSRITQIVFEGLVKMGSGKDLQPCLAESWKIDDNGLDYSFKLRPGIKFSNGDPVTAEDWVWSFERMMEHKQGAWALYASVIDSVTAIGEDTLQISLNTVSASFLATLALPCFAVQSKAESERLGHDAYIKSPMGTGAFYFDAWRRREYYRMIKNPYYHGEAGTGVDSIYFKYIEDGNTRVRQLKEGLIDVCVDVPANRVAELKAEGFDVNAHPLAEQRYVNLNVTKPPLDNAKVRRALRMATDREKIVRTAVMGGGEPSYNAFWSGGTYFSDEIADEGYDIDKAAAILAEAGFPDGFETEISFIDNNAISENIAVILNEEWGKIGVRLKLTPMENDEYLKCIEELEHSVTTLRWADETSSPSGFASFIGNYEYSKGFRTGYSNPRITELARIGETAADEAARESAYLEMQKIICDEAPFYPIYRALSFIASKSGGVFEQTEFGSLTLAER